MTRAALALLVVCCFGCKKKSVDVYAELQNDICRCTELACIEAVAKHFRERTGLDPQKATTDNAEAMAQIQECVRNIVAITTPADAAPPVANVPAMPPKREADALINAARTWQKDPKLAIAELTASYVDASGLLDDTHGVLTIAFGAASRPVDDPKRKTGAPVVADTPRPVTCPSIASLPDRGWSSFDDTCRDAEPYIAKCGVVDIWKKAIKLGAPKDALAVITFKNVVPPQWGFNITDEPRKVHIAHELPDDCERTLEKP